MGLNGSDAPAAGSKNTAFATFAGALFFLAGCLFTLSAVSVIYQGVSRGPSYATGNRAGGLLFSLSNLIERIQSFNMKMVATKSWCMGLDEMARTPRPDRASIREQMLEHGCDRYGLRVR